MDGLRKHPGAHATRRELLIESGFGKRKARHRQSSSVNPSGSAVAFLLLLMMTDNDDDNDDGDDNQIEDTQFR